MQQQIIPPFPGHAPGIGGRVARVLLGCGLAFWLAGCAAPGRPAVTGSSPSAVTSTPAWTGIGLPPADATGDVGGAVTVTMPPTTADPDNTDANPPLISDETVAAEQDAAGTTMTAAATDMPDLAAAAPSEKIVAMLLPLNGPHAQAGHALLNAAQIALFDVGNPDVILMPFDTEGTPEAAGRAARAAVTAGAGAVIGPLLAPAVQAVKPIAGTAGIPVVVFSNSAAVAGDGVYLAGFTPRPQVRLMVEAAVGEERRRIAILAPDNDYGRTVTAALQEVTPQAGAELARVGIYDPGAADFSDPVRRISDYDQRHAALLQAREELAVMDDDASRRALRRLENLDTIGELPFDAILLAATEAQNLKILASQLAFYDVDLPAARIYGLQPWDGFGDMTREPSLMGGRYIAPPDGERVKFSNRYRALYGRAPLRLASLAYDVTALVASLMARQTTGGTLDRAALTDRKGFYGTDGLFRFTPEGLTERGFAVLEINPEGPRTVRPAPRRFDEQLY